MTNTAWTVLYYESPEGNCPVIEFIDSLSKRSQAKIFSFLSLLEEKGPILPRPYADFLEDGIHELRIKLSGNQVRILYFFCYQEYIVLTHSFTKKTDKVPATEIKKANALRIDFLKRFNEKNLREVKNENL